MGLRFLAFALTCFIQIAQALEVHNITRFSNDAFENLAIRRNGQVLITNVSPAAHLYQIDPLRIRPPVLVADFPDLSGSFGIHELHPDISHVATGNVSLTNPSDVYPETLGVHEVDMRSFRAAPNGTILYPAKVRKAASIPDGKLLNGLTSVSGARDFVLVSDTFVGLIWRVNIRTGAVDIAFQDSTTAGTGRGPSTEGVNGMQVYEKDLYYCNTGGAAIYKVPIASNGYVLNGTKPVLVADNLPCDDFTLDNIGNLYVASTMNAVFKITPAGQKAVLAGTVSSNRGALVGTTSVKSGRGDSNYGSLYVTTNGLDTADGTIINGTQGLSRVDGVGSV